MMAFGSSLFVLYRAEARDLYAAGGVTHTHYFDYADAYTTYLSVVRRRLTQLTLTLLLHYTPFLAVVRRRLTQPTLTVLYALHTHLWRKHQFRAP